MSTLFEKRQELWQEVLQEMLRAESEHGPLTTDMFRAYTIMGEEFGEIGRAMLEHRRAKSDHEKSEKAEHIRAELIQLASVSLHLALQY